MRANGYTCTDYRREGARLALDLAGVGAEEALAADWSLVRIETDAGDLAELFAGWSAESATLSAAGGALTLRLACGAEGAALDALRDMGLRADALDAEAADVRARLDSTDEALAELAGIIAGGE